MASRSRIFSISAIIACLLLLCASCSPLTKVQKQENRVAKKIEKLQGKYPEAFDNISTVRIDTVIKEIYIEGKTVIDTVEVTNILEQYIHDTVHIPTFIDRFLQATRDTVQVDSLDVHLWISGSAVTYRMQRDSAWIQKEAETITITKTEVVRKNFVQDWKFWVLLIIVVLISQRHQIRRIL